MDWYFWAKVAAFWIGAGWAVLQSLRHSKQLSTPTTPTEQRVRLADNWRESIRRDMHREGMRRANSLKVVK